MGRETGDRFGQRGRHDRQPSHHSKQRRSSMKSITVRSENVFWNSKVAGTVPVPSARIIGF